MLDTVTCVRRNDEPVEKSYHPLESLLGLACPGKRKAGEHKSWIEYTLLDMLCDLLPLLKICSLRPLHFQTCLMIGQPHPQGHGGSAWKGQGKTHGSLV